MPSHFSSNINILELTKYRARPRIENIMPLVHFSFLWKPTRIHAKFAADLSFALYVCSAALVLLNVFSTEACHTEACSLLFPV